MKKEEITKDLLLEIVHNNIDKLKESRSINYHYDSIKAVLEINSSDDIPLLLIAVEFENCKRKTGWFSSEFYTRITGYRIVYFEKDIEYNISKKEYNEITYKYAIYQNEQSKQNEKEYKKEALNLLKKK